MLDRLLASRASTVRIAEAAVPHLKALKRSVEARQRVEAQAGKTGWTPALVSAHRDLVKAQGEVARGLVDLHSDLDRVVAGILKG